MRTPTPTVLVVARRDRRAGVAARFTEGGWLVAFASDVHDVIAADFDGASYELVVFDAGFAEDAACYARRRRRPVALLLLDDGPARVLLAPGATAR